MAKTGYLYRRSSGIYVVRICVPLRLRPLVGKGELHITTQTRDLVAAKVVAFRIMAHWQHQVAHGKASMDVVTVAGGSPLLSGTGGILVADAAQLLGLSRSEILTELLNIQAELLCRADGWSGIAVPIEQVERDFDGAFLLDSALAEGEPRLVNRYVLFSSTTLAIPDLIATGEYVERQFYLDAMRQKALFFDNPGKTVRYEAVYVLKRDVERVRVRLAKGITPAMLEADRAERFVTPVPVVSHAPTSPPGHKFGKMRASELVAKFCAAKQGDWGLERQQRMAQSYSLFVELIDDPFLDEIDRELMRTYVELLRGLPANAHRVSASSGVTALRDLAKLAKAEGLPLLSEATVTSHAERMSELFGWAVKEDYLVKNLAMGLATTKKTEREQDARDVFSDADLEQIFGADWFQNGRGCKSPKGKYPDFRPHYYWLPLLGLYTGARLTELSQLYVTDIHLTDSGTYYFDFNLEGEDKVKDGEKSLKNVNSVRVVPVHQKLLELGLIEYVHELRRIGQVRLFPEITRDRVKGYGKDPGKWFNGRYLGEYLKFPRDGKKTFHSFRHMFTTALYAARIDSLTVNQLIGHERGETLSEKRYRKDDAANALVGTVNKLAYNIPELAKFDVSAGMDALDWILKEKQRRAKINAREKRLAI